MRLVIFGPQGAGKGTQSARIASKYDIPSISTGDIFRWAIKEGTEVGRKAERYVSTGRLVPDEITIEVVRERLQADDAREGFLLDGFPRNVQQAKELDAILASQSAVLDGAILLEVDEEVSLRRLLGRRVCSACGANYSLDVPPTEDWICDVCGGRVETRADDLDEATVRERLAQYHAQTTPLKKYYGAKGLLRSIDGVGSPDEVFDRIVAAL